MAALKLNRLKEIVRNAYVAGNSGCMEMVDEYAEEVLAEVTAEIQRNKNNPGGGEWRVYSAEELKKKPFGTVFEHSRLGQCWIDGSSESKKCMTFASGEQSYFVQNIEPWDEPMREVGKL